MDMGFTTVSLSRDLLGIYTSTEYTQAGRVSTSLIATAAGTTSKIS